MENLLNYPQSTIVNRIVPKTMFYKFMEVNPRMKTHFVNDVVNITWLYKLSAGSLNVMDADNLKEIEVFVAQLKQPDCPTDLFSFNLDMITKFSRKHAASYRFHSDS